MMIKKIETKKLERAGYKNIIETSISDATVRNYLMKATFLDVTIILSSTHSSR
jgi:hypothetical protein